MLARLDHRCAYSLREATVTQIGAPDRHGDRVRPRRASRRGDRRRRHARCRVDAQQLLRVDRLGRRLHARQRSADHRRRARRIVRRDPVLHHVQGDESLDLERDLRWLRSRRHRNPSAGAAKPAQPAGEVQDIDAARVSPRELKEAKSVIIVPGYGMAVGARAACGARAHRGASQAPAPPSASRSIPVAGRLPGHMNVLLAEANVPYDIVLEMDEINAGLPDHRRRDGDRCQRHREPGSRGRSDLADRRHAGAPGLEDPSS